MSQEKQEPDEIEITLEMVEAGVTVLRQSGRVSETLPDWAADRVIRDILLASLHNP